MSCSVPSCNNYSKRNCHLFHIPSDRDKNNKFNALCAKRRKLWLVALRRRDISKDLTGKKIESARICNRHFLTGKPAALDDMTDPDWIPRINMGYPAKFPKVKSKKLIKLKKQDCQNIENLNNNFQEYPGKENCVSSSAASINVQCDTQIKNNSMSDSKKNRSSPNKISTPLKLKLTSQSNIVVEQIDKILKRNEEIISQSQINLPKEEKRNNDILKHNKEISPIKAPNTGEFSSDVIDVDKEEIVVEPDLPDVIFVSEEILVEPDILIQGLLDESDESIKEEIITDFNLPNLDFDETLQESPFLQNYNKSIDTTSPHTQNCEENIQFDEVNTLNFLQNDEIYLVSDEENMDVDESITQIEEGTTEPSFLQIEETSSGTESIRNMNKSDVLLHSKVLSSEDKEINILQMEETHNATKNTISKPNVPKHILEYINTDNNFLQFEEKIRTKTRTTKDLTRNVLQSKNITEPQFLHIKKIRTNTELNQECIEQQHLSENQVVNEDKLKGIAPITNENNLNVDETVYISVLNHFPFVTTTNEFGTCQICKKIIKFSSKSKHIIQHKKHDNFVCRKCKQTKTGAQK